MRPLVWERAHHDDDASMFCGVGCWVAGLPRRSRLRQGLRVMMMARCHEVVWDRPIGELVRRKKDKGIVGNGIFFLF